MVCVEDEFVNDVNKFFETKELHENGLRILESSGEFDKFFESLKNKKRGIFNFVKNILKEANGRFIVRGRKNAKR